MSTAVEEGRSGGEGDRLSDGEGRKVWVTDDGREREGGHGYAELFAPSSSPRRAEKYPKIPAVTNMMRL